MALNLGDITFALGTDTSGLDRAAQKLVQFSQKVDSAAKSTSDGAAEIAAAYKKQEAAITSALNKVLNLNASIVRSGAESTGMTQQVAAAFQKYTNTLTAGAASALVFQRANERLNLSLGGVSRNLAAINSGSAGAAAGTLAARMKDLASAAVLVTGPLGGIAARLTVLTGIINRDAIAWASFVIGIGLGAYALDKLGKAALEAGKEVDAIKEALSAIGGGNNTLGSASFADLVDIANKSGFKIKDLAEQWTNFAEVTKDTALAGQKGEQVFSDLTVVMGNLHRSPDQVSGALRTMQQMLDNNTVSAMQLKRQLGNDLPGAFKEAQKAMGFTGANGTANFVNALKKNQISPDTLLPKMMEQYIKDLNMGKEAVDTYEASQNRLHNANLVFFNDLDKALGITAASKDGYNALTSVVEMLDKALTHAGPAVKALTSGLLTFVGVGGALLTLAKVAEVAAAGFAALGISFGGLALLTPPGWVIGIVATLVAATAAIYTYLHASEDSSAATKDTTKATNEYIASLKAVGGASNAAMFAGNSQWNAQKKAVEDAKKELADYTKQQDIVIKNRAFAHISLVQPGDDQKKYGQLKNNVTEAQKALDSLQATLSRTGKSTKFGLNDDQLTKIQETKNKLTEMNMEIRQGTAVLNSGGLVAYKKLQEQFADNKKVLEYAKALDSVPASMRAGLMTVEEYRLGLQKFTQTLDKARLQEQAMKEMQSGVANSFGTVGEALKQLVTKGKLDFAALADSARSAAADIINTFLKLSVMNPLENSLFGLSGTSGELPSIGGLGGFLGSLLGGGGFSPGGVNNPVNAMGDSIAAPGFAKGGAWSNGIRFLASGGILNSPTLFNTSGGMAVGGEAGTEAVMPLVRGPGGKLGVQQHGGGGSGPVNVYINTPNYQSFAHPASQAQLATQMRKTIAQAQRNS